MAILASLKLEPGATWFHPFLGYELIILKADALSLVFALIFSIMAFLGAVYALHVENRGEHIAALLYAAGSLGVVFAGDWLTLFFFWELMSASSVFLIWYRGKKQSLAAGFRYLLVHFLGGNLLLFGILLLIGSGNLAVSTLTESNSPAFWLILLGVAINAAIPPLHAWLTDAYPEATISGSVFLSALTTKVAVYVLVRVFPGTELLLWAGVVMALYGVVYAVLENNIRRLLAYHIISQVGYMVAAVGMGTELALNGATAHAFSHILYKALLFMGAGAVIYATGREKLTELGGIARAMPLTFILYNIGAFSISGVPLFNGFISKSIVVTAAGVSGLGIAELLLTLAGVGTFLSIALKLPYFTFFGQDRGLKPQKLPLNMYIAMAGGAFLCILYGIFPDLLYTRLPYPLSYEPYTMDHVISTIQLLLATALGFWLFLAKLKSEPAISLDTDWFYRKPLAALLQGIVYGLKQMKVKLEEGVMLLFRAAGPYFESYNENRYRFPVGLNFLLGIIFLGFIIILALV
ncbi:MAG: multicomponent Na+:H+ antiporter subunit [Clostridia bacterium]|nr:multicomponent Na+:H+ antiporter subunit [Clostridia bacterium]